MDLSGTLTATDLDVELYLDQTVIQRWTLTGTQSINVPIHLDTNQFQTITLALSPICPTFTDPSLECQTLSVTDLAIGEFIPAESEPVEFDDGIKLNSGYVSDSVQAGETLTVRLDWLFEQARDENDIRFVHVVDAAGQPVVQDDMTLGSFPAGTRHAERVDLDLPDNLPAGEYQVFVGWYIYPTLTRFDVLSPVDGATDGLVLLGEIAVE